MSLAFFGFSVSAIGGKPDCAVDNTHPSCTTDTTIKYTAALVLGGFRFNPVAITLHKGSYSSAFQLYMDRPSAENSPPPGQVTWNIVNQINIDQLMWDEVFLECFDVFAGANIDGVIVSNEWGITQGGRKKSDNATNIRVTFRNVFAPDFQNVDIDFSLFTRLSYERSLFKPEIVGVPSVYPLEMAQIFADDRGNQTSCASGEFTLQSGTVGLEITRVN
jgi:hypothetical protein